MYQVHIFKGFHQQAINCESLDQANATVIDYDTEGVEKERLAISPVDGELCVINKW